MLGIFQAKTIKMEKTIMKTFNSAIKFHQLDLSETTLLAGYQVLAGIKIQYFKKGKYYCFSLFDNDTGEEIHHDDRGFNRTDVLIAAIRWCESLLKDIDYCYHSKKKAV